MRPATDAATLPDALDQAAAGFAAASKSAATRRAYEADWRDFLGWCAEQGEAMDDLDRPDLEPQIRRGIAAAVRHFQPERFAFNERILTFQTIPGADVYGLRSSLWRPGPSRRSSPIPAAPRARWSRRSRRRPPRRRPRSG
ncbi:hypothetical protein MKK64_17425 [Methylobacterium sp. E-025]|uniref:hypothetical protein n=1 Tax=Methylobacterium sp. E-025 TaxID=2836561 RepID=UPI001FB93488|nr:hypothetical protein [Methylobacterium sp. E-025]MCJ2112964.1 hypothetical protein [Methylobacterium sp. E-025]